MTQKTEDKNILLTYGGNVASLEANMKNDKKTSVHTRYLGIHGGTTERQMQVSLFTFKDTGKITAVYVRNENGNARISRTIKASDTVLVQIERMEISFNSRAVSRSEGYDKASLKMYAWYELTTGKFTPAAIIRDKSMVSIEERKEFCTIQPESSVEDHEAFQVAIKGMLTAWHNGLVNHSPMTPKWITEYQSNQTLYGKMKSAK